jgi:hypothetical protein
LICERTEIDDGLDTKCQAIVGCARIADDQTFVLRYRGTSGTALTSIKNGPYGDAPLLRV